MTVQAVQSNQSPKYDQASNLFQRGEYENAASLLGESLLEEQTSERWNDWGAAKYMAGRVIEAEGGFRRALELDPENLQAVLNLGASLASQERYSEAIPLLESIISRGNADENGPAAKLLNACRAQAACKVGVESGDREMVKFYKTVAMSMSSQTVTLDRVLFRMISLEAGMQQFAQRCEKVVDEIHGRLATPQAGQKLLPTIPLTEICPMLPAIELRAPIGVDGNTSLYELVVISSLVKALSARNVFEIGTFNGRTTLNFAANVAEHGKIFTLDLPRQEMWKTGLPICDGDKTYINKDRSGALFVGTALEGSITQLYGDSATFDFSPYQGQIDFVFIDGSHAYKYVLNDSRKALSMLRPGKGTILWHDYPGWPGVADALHELFLKDPAFANLRTIEGTAFAYLQA